MRKYLLILIFLKIACAAWSQQPPASDTVCLPVPQVSSLLRSKDSLKIMQAERDSTALLADIRAGFIKKQQITIDSLNKAADAGSLAFNDMQKSRDFALQENELNKQDALMYKKEATRQKKRKTWVIIGAIVAQGASIYLLSK